MFGEGSPIPIFITGKPKEGLSQILVTISNSDGEKTVYISKDQMMESKAKYFVQTPPERIVSGLDKWLRMAFSTFKLSGYVGAIALLTLSLFTFTGVVKA